MIRDEQNIDTTEILPDLKNAMMKTSHIALGFTYGTNAGKKRVEEAAAELGFEHFSVRFNEKLDSHTFSVSTGMRTFLENVGYKSSSRCAPAMARLTLRVASETRLAIRGQLPWSSHRITSHRMSSQHSGALAFTIARLGSPFSCVADIANILSCPE
ncbi:MULTISPECIES: hypothetical protein [unclassified Neorhizobium]|uniref:hypothetical protein n=1 Tax=unclassified Neorhizobium TaxID=2629175 RepID=UPI001FF2F669|nr:MULTISPECIES: hypothetical protein [unclassified Neorhizobium]MCJ9674450.1 hypothetical protein [Neorhizobium sp. SHOUNA12B]MCJ9746577.1 hypothetical protein [Neorhizobium sp. SHOUNA12A]